MTNYQDARQNFANRLREIRVEKGLTQEQLAELVGKSTEHISLLERAERSPSFEVLLDLTRALSVPVAWLLGDLEGSVTISETLDLAPIPYPLSQPAQEASVEKAQQRSDLERLDAAFKGIREAQTLADEYGINDILQDNGGKVLQVLILLGLRISPGREGNDALDDAGNEYELKTINHSLRKNAGITTHHHLNKDILNKYRSVKAWFIAIYEGVELKEIYKVAPVEFEPLFQQWEQKIVLEGRPLNNPKIPMRYVRKGELVYPPSDTHIPQQESLDLYE